VDVATSILGVPEDKTQEDPVEETTPPSVPEAPPPPPELKPGNFGSWFHQK
jgi:hypothetical protein